MTQELTVTNQNESADVPIEPEIPRRHWIALFGGLLGAFMAILDIQNRQLISKRHSRRVIGNDG